MNRLLIYSLALVAMCSCNSAKVKIEGRLIGAESTTLYLERIENSTPTLIDSVMLNGEGRFNLAFEGVAEEPLLYNLVSGGERIPLFLTAGDNISINAMGNISGGYRVEGSEESEVLRQFYQPYIKGIGSLDAIANDYASPKISEEERKELATKYAKEYQAIKQAQLRFIIENQSRMAAVYALFQRLPGDEYLFNGDNDIIYLRTVADALEQSYPNSSYLKSLRNSISKMESNIELQSKVSSSNFPELELPDIFGKSVKLSSLAGGVILLDFWSPELGNSNAHNAEFKEVYSKYNRGFEIYQVAVDNSKSRWIAAVQDQRLPWISVNDLKGNSSPALGSYNITKVPSNFLIDAQGTIIARDLTGSELDAQLKILLTE
ncbi:MAG: TlpA disulfide reductase family protein [Rikenellaceae bacterium]